MFENEADDRLAQLIQDHFKYLHWEEDDIELAAMWIRTMAMGLGILNLPVTHRKFPEALRCLANILELIQSEKTKTKK